MHGKSGNCGNGGGAHHRQDSLPRSVGFVVLCKSYSALPPLSLCSTSSTTHAVASSSVLISRYPVGFRPAVLAAVVIPTACITSSSWASFNPPCDRSRLRSFVSRPWIRWASPIRALPSAVLGPDPLPPWCPHFLVVLIFNAGLRHCSRVFLLIAVHRTHLILPPAVTRYFSGLSMR